MQACFGVPHCMVGHLRTVQDVHYLCQNLARSHHQFLVSQVKEIRVIASIWMRRSELQLDSNSVVETFEHSGAISVVDFEKDVIKGWGLVEFVGPRV